MSSAVLTNMVVVVCILMYPGSPRSYKSKGRQFKACQSMCKLRYNKIQATRDIYYMHTLLEAENDIEHGRNRFVEINRSATGQARNDRFGTAHDSAAGTSKFFHLRCLSSGGCGRRH